MRKALFVILIFLCCTGCQSAVKQIHFEDCKTYFAELPSYEAIVEMKVKGENSETKYVFEQSYFGDGKYKHTMKAPEDVTGEVVTFDQKEMRIYHPGPKHTIAVNNPYQLTNGSVFPSHFLTVVADAPDGKRATIEGRDCFVIEDRAKGVKLWIDRATITPWKMESNSLDGKTKVEIHFQSFTPGKK